MREWRVRGARPSALGFRKGRRVREEKRSGFLRAGVRERSVCETERKRRLHFEPRRGELAIERYALLFALSTCTHLLWY